MKMTRIAITALALALFMAPALPAQQDQEGGKDHPLFSRMPGYFISGYDEKDFDRAEFEGRDGNPVAVEGRCTRIAYNTVNEEKYPSPIQVSRNYQNAVKKIGGVVIYDEMGSGGGATTMKLVRGAEEVWVRVGVGNDGRNYQLIVVEKAGMEQVVTADADAWKSDIGATGHAAVYGIYFDTDKSVVKPESEPALKEIANLLQKDPKLNIRVVGHTDASGDLAHNMTLSEARAKAVVEALTTKHLIAAARLTAHGVGPLAPVASNDTEEGRAKNRRVELVKK